MATTQKKMIFRSEKQPEDLTISVITLFDNVKILEEKIDSINTKIDKIENKIDHFVDKHQCLENKLIKCDTKVSIISKFIWLITGTIIGILAKLLI